MLFQCVGSTGFHVDFNCNLLRMPALADYDKGSRTASISFVPVGGATLGQMSDLARRFSGLGYYNYQIRKGGRMKFAAITGSRGWVFPSCIHYHQMDAKASDPLQNTGVHVYVDFRPRFKSFSVGYLLRFVGDGWVNSLSEYLGLGNSWLPDLVSSAADHCFDQTITPLEVRSKIRVNIRRQRCEFEFPYKDHPAVKYMTISAGTRSIPVDQERFDEILRAEPMGSKGDVDPLDFFNPKGRFVAFGVHLRKNVIGPVPGGFQDLWESLITL